MTGFVRLQQSWPYRGGCSCVLATREFVANDDGGRGVAPPRCCTAGSDSSLSRAGRRGRWCPNRRASFVQPWTSAMPGATSSLAPSVRCLVLVRSERQDPRRPGGCSACGSGRLAVVGRRAAPLAHKQQWRRDWGISIKGALSRVAAKVLVRMESGSGCPSGNIAVRPRAGFSSLEAGRCSSAPAGSARAATVMRTAVSLRVSRRD